MAVPKGPPRVAKTVVLKAVSRAKSKAELRVVSMVVL